MIPEDETMNKVVIFIGCTNIFISVVWIDLAIYFMARLKDLTADDDDYFSECEFIIKKYLIDYYHNQFNISSQ